MNKWIRRIKLYMTSSSDVNAILELQDKVNELVDEVNQLKNPGQTPRPRDIEPPAIEDSDDLPVGCIAMIVIALTLIGLFVASNS